jgi:UDP-N-acetylmuramyl-tripeptide synthetase
LIDMKIKELIDMLGCGLHPGAAGLEVEISEVTADSRSVGPLVGNGGSDGGVLFAAVPGERTDGLDYICDASEAGAAAILTRAPVDGVDAVQLIVPDVRRSLADAASAVYGWPSERLAMMAVTGTNGKTTISYLLESILKTAGLRSGVVGTVNYRYGDKIYPAPNTTPEAPDLQRLLSEMVACGVTHCVMEVSSHALAQERARGTGFDVAVFTNLTHEHLDYHNTMEEYYAAKALLFTGHMKDASTAIINIDDPWGRRLAGSLPGLRIQTVSLSGPEGGATVYPESYRFHSGGVEAELMVSGTRVTVTSALVGEYNLQNIMEAAAAAIALGVNVTDISLGIAALDHVPGRLEAVDGCPGFSVYVDYAHTADALGRAIGALRGVSKARVITVFGCGGNRDRAKRPEMGKVSARLSDVTIITTDNPRDEDPMKIIAEVVAGINETGETGARRCDDASVLADGTGLYTVVPDRGEAIRTAVSIARKGDVVLVAGKGHEDYQIVGGERRHFSDIEAVRSAAPPAAGDQRLEARG